MTAHRDEHGPADPTDRELTRHHEAFTAKIEAALDVEAGLRDILFQSRHEAFTVKVETALDVETGLRDILTPPTNQMPSTPPAVAPPVANTAPGSSRWQATPAQRLKLRSNSRVAAASRVLRVVGNWASTSLRDLDRDRAHGLARDPVRDLDRDPELVPVLVRDLDRALDLARALDLNLDLDLARAHGLARDLARAHGLARDLARAHSLARDLDFDRALDLALDLGYDLDRGLDCARARDLAFALARALDPARAFDSDLVLARVLDLVRDLALSLDRDLARARYRCLQIINDEYTQAVGAPVAVDEESLASLMDDFTTDDLSNADVREDDINLTGVRWSDGTTWPASTDIYRLKRRSDRQEDGSWIIRAGTGNVRENILS